MTRRLPAHALPWSFLLIVTLIAPPLAAEPVTGKVTDVTLYRGQAMVSREVPVPAGVGEMELIVTGLPYRVRGESLFAEGGDGLTVRAVRFRTRVVSEEPREQVRELDEQIQDTRDQIAAAEKMLEVLQQRSKYLDQLQNGVLITAAKAEITEDAPKPEAIQSLTQFVFEQRSSIARETLEVQFGLRDLRKQLEVQLAQRKELTQGAQRRVSEAVLFLSKTGQAAGTVRLGYLVDGCGWAPGYNFRADRDASQIRVEYVALITQFTGEDWQGVNLTLSTATPRVSAAVPGFASLPVVLARGGAALDAAPAVAGREYADLKQAQARLAQQAAKQPGYFKDNLDLGWRLNDLGNRQQLLELNTRIVDERRDAAGLTTTEPALTYALPGQVSVASRNDQQMMRILAEDLDAEFYHVAMPVLSEFVYREAELVNATSGDLLGGPASVYLDGRFVGRTEIPTVARGQTFVVGLGADPQLRTSRELVQRDEDTQGGNKVRTFTYRLAIENFNDRQHPVRLFDRLPNPKGGKDVRVTLGELETPLSDDAVYLRTRRPDGILRWDLTIAPNTSGETARVVNYDYTIEFDRNFTLTAQDEQVQRELFERQERDRFRR